MVADEGPGPTAVLDVRRRGRRRPRSPALLAALPGPGAAAPAALPHLVRAPARRQLPPAQRQEQNMNIAFCYESVLPTRGGCETYIADLARRLIADRHEVHLYACRWDDQALPEEMQFHRLRAPGGPRFLRPWRFARLCLEALAQNNHDVTVGFDKTYGQDVLYPQGGLHAASFEHNLNKYPGKFMRGLARLVKFFDPAHRSFTKLERRQYLGGDSPLIVVNSFMVREHFQKHLGMSKHNLKVVRSAIDPERFPEHDRPKRRQEYRSQWGIQPGEVVGLIAAMNYRLKGLDPLLHAVESLFGRPEFNKTPPSFRL